MAMKWYVYEVCCPDRGRFYVGKGCGRRMYAHLSRSHSDVVNARIRSIRAQGKEPEVRELAYFYDEQDALRYEADLINTSEDLLNIARNPAPVRTIGLLETFFKVVKGDAVRPRDLVVSIWLARSVGDSFDGAYAKIAVCLFKVAKSRYGIAV